MEKILVPTDFSAIADNALDYAIEIAAVFGSKIYLYHIYSFDSFNYDHNFPKHDQPYTKKLVRQMERTQAKFSEKINAKGLTVQTFVEEENFYSLFQTKVAAYQIEMIIMGSKGASGLTKVLFGSVAATALDTAKIPLLIVPPEHRFHPIKKIVLAIDASPVTPKTLSLPKKLATCFGGEVILLNVLTGSNKNTGGVSDLQPDSEEFTFREVPMSKNINETIDRFIGEEGGDLLCMIHQEKGIFKKLFQKSPIRAQVFRTRVPLLVLPEV